MASARRSELAEVAEVNGLAPADQPKLLVMHGRGGSGKSTLVRVIVERATEAGREVAVADADRTNATLGSFLKNVTRPELPDDKTVSDWLDDLMNQQAETRMSVALDMGGGDQVFKRFASSLELADLLAGEGIMPVAVHCLGPDVDSLAYLNDIEASRAFCPPSTILVLNEGLIRDSRPREAAFAEVREHSIYRSAQKRGVREIWFPALTCMQEVNTKRLSFSAAERQLGLTNRQRVAIWRRAVEHALEPIADWLP